MADNDQKKASSKPKQSSASLGDVFKELGKLIRVSWRRRKKKWRKARAKRQEEKRIAPKLTKKQLLKRKKKRNRVIRRVCLSVFTLIFVLVGGLACVLGTVFYGPSETACDLLVNSLLETSAAKFIPHLYFSDDQVNDIIARNAIVVPDEATDTSLVVIDTGADNQQTSGGVQDEYKDIEICEVSGATFKGWMMIVRDPSRVVTGVCNNPFGDAYGKNLNEIAENYGAVAAINAGGFEDDGGTGKGGIPIGIVYSEGELLWKKTHGYYDTLIGFDKDDKLVIAPGITASESQKLNLRDGVTFGPALVINGEAAAIKGSSSGLNPRTAIGQRADGAVLMLVIDGRQVNSLGASLSDLIDVMLEYGAINAANLDGGSSSKLYYEGEYLNDGVAVTGSRRINTAFVVK